MADLLKLLFIPDENYFQGKIDDVRNKFGFADDIATNFAMIVSFFTDTDFAECPNVQINLGNANSDTIGNYTGIVEGINVSWYAPYKSTCDKFISGFLWIAFIFNLYRHLPNIINGIGTATVVTTKIGMKYGEEEED